MTELFTEPENEMSTALVEHESLTPLEMIRTFIERPDSDPAGLEKLMDLYDRWKNDSAREAYMAAMKACKEELPIVVRDAENRHTQSRYARLETVSLGIDPITTKHGFSLSYGTADSPKEEHVRILCDCMHEGGYSQRYQLDCPYDSAGAKGTVNKTPIQAMGSTISYGRRYLKLMIFDVTVANEDDDGQQGAVITPDQIGEINDLLVSFNATRGDFDRFLRFMEVESLDRIPAKKFQDAVSHLKRKAEQRKAGQ